MTEITPQQEIEKLEMKELLRGIRIGDYAHLEDPGVGEWQQPREDMPDDFWAKFKDLSSETHMFELLSHIDRELYDPERNHHGAKSFQDSRFTSLAEMIDRKVVSCGAKSKIFSEILRRFHVPVQLVHLTPIDDPDNPMHKHSWIRILNPATKGWITIDPTRTRFRYGLEEGIYQESGIYHSWTELKSDFERGKY